MEASKLGLISILLSQVHVEFIRNLFYYHYVIVTKIPSPTQKKVKQRKNIRSKQVDKSLILACLDFISKAFMLLYQIYIHFFLFYFMFFSPWLDFILTFLFSFFHHSSPKCVHTIDLFSNSLINEIYLDISIQIIYTYNSISFVIFGL